MLHRYPPRIDCEGLLEGKNHSVVKERTSHIKDELSTTYDQYHLTRAFISFCVNKFLLIHELLLSFFIVSLYITDWLYKHFRFKVGYI